MDLNDSCERTAAFLEALKWPKGRVMKVAYEDVRFQPQGELTHHLPKCSIEHELGYGTDPTHDSTISTPTIGNRVRNMMAAPGKHSGGYRDIGRHAEKENDLKMGTDDIRTQVQCNENITLAMIKDNVFIIGYAETALL